MELTKQVLEEIAGVVQHVSDDELKAAVRCIRRDRRVFVSGEGRSGLMAKGFAMRLMHLGYQSFVIGETITPALGANDILVCVSGSGESAYTVHDARKAQNTGCDILAVTAQPASTLGKLATHVLLVPGTVRTQSGEARRSIQLLGTLFDQSLHIVLDILCLLLSRRDNVSNETATGRHW